jgi:hypothetical protein
MVLVFRDKPVGLEHYTLSVVAADRAIHIVEDTLITLTE